MGQNRTLLIWLVALCLLLPSGNNPLASTSQVDGSLEIGFQSGRLTIRAYKVPLYRLLGEITNRTGVVIRTAESSSGYNEIVSLTAANVTIEEALKRLSAHRAFVYTYHPEEKVYVLTEAGVYPDGVHPTQVPPGQAVRSEPVLKENVAAIPSVPVQTISKGVKRPAYFPGELLVQLRTDADAKDVAALHAALGSKVLSRVPTLRLERIRLRSGWNEEKALARYQSSGLVEMAERHARRYINVTPNDSFFGLQWGHTASRSSGGWQFTTGNTNIVVAVIDTGVRYQHPDLASNIWVNSNEIPGNGLDDDANGYVDDIRGWDFADYDADPADGDPGNHGTHVAGIIGARGNNGTGVAGVAWNVKIMPLKVLPDGGDSIASIDVINAIVYAIENGARVVNCSFGGGGGFSSSEHLAFTLLRNAGVLAVCSAGNGVDNDGNPVDTDLTPHYPSGYVLENIVSVAAGNQSDGLAGFSNFGAASVDLMAPGVSILSTVNNSGYGYKSGTSMSAPFVAGVAGLMLSRQPGWFYSELKAAILNTATRLPALSGKVLSGGKLNTHFALCSTGTAAGDVTCDNTVGDADSVAALQIAAGAGPDFCVACVSAGIDINGDNKIGLQEAAYATRKEAGL